MKNIAAKMVAAMAAIDAVEKRGKNQVQSYSYVKATDVANEVRKVLHEQGIAFAYQITDTEHWEKMKWNNASNQFEIAQFVCQIRVTCTFTDKESGESMMCDGIGWGTDPLDKAPYKAMTGALKYVLRMAFLIPDESDPENEKEQEKPQEPRKPQKKETSQTEFKPDNFSITKEQWKEMSDFANARHVYEAFTAELKRRDKTKIGDIKATEFNEWMDYIKEL